MSDDAVLIEFSVTRRDCDGWVPLVTNNGRQLCGEWSSHKHTRKEALHLAEARAREEAARYSGDWTITVRPMEGE